MIAAVARAHGVRGVVRVRPTGATFGTLGRGDAVTAAWPDGRRQTLEVAHINDQTAGPLVQFVGIDDRNGAEALRGAVLVAPVERLPPLDDDEFYVRDMLGCQVMIGGRVVGEVAQVLPGTANDVLEVQPSGEGRTFLVPFSRDAIVKVDGAARVITVREGLIDEPGS